LPRQQFPEKLQLVLIDGPHAYPFPDLEYYFLYPHLDIGGLLILDDIQIRSIHNLFAFLCADSMFRLDEVVRSTAFFTRTDAPTFDPTGDGWQEQRYNVPTLIRYDWRSRLRSALPASAIRRVQSLRRRVTHGKSACSVEIHSPNRGDRVSEGGTVTGTAHLAEDGHLWALVHRKDIDGWWPQGEGEIAVAAHQWTVQVKYGGPEDAGFDFEIAAVIVCGPCMSNGCSGFDLYSRLGSTLPCNYRIQERCFQPLIAPSKKDKLRFAIELDAPAFRTPRLLNAPAETHEVNGFLTKDGLIGL
jgi:hypothetical protein